MQGEEISFKLACRLKHPPAQQSSMANSGEEYDSVPIPSANGYSQPHVLLHTDELKTACIGNRARNKIFG